MTINDRYGTMSRMNTRLHTMAIAQGGVFSSDEAAAVGVTSNELSALIRKRELFRFRRGAYVLAERYRAADIDARYRLRVLAVMRTRPRTDCASHHSALALHGISFYGAPLDLVIAQGHRTDTQRCNGLIVQPRTVTSGSQFGVVRSVAPALACVQVAARFGFEAGVCAMDSALHLGTCTKPDLEAALEQIPLRQRRRARHAIAATEPLTESVGESRTRLILSDAGFRLTPQVELRNAVRFLGRVDFVVNDCVVVEFDGLVKYAGKDGKMALASEKDRESEITRLGYEVVRIIWSELEDTSAILDRVWAAERLARDRRAGRPR